MTQMFLGELKIVFVVISCNLMGGGWWVVDELWQTGDTGAEQDYVGIKQGTLEKINYV